MKPNFLLFLFIFSSLLCSCGGGVKSPNVGLTLAPFVGFGRAEYRLDKKEIQAELLRLAHEDVDSMTADYRVRSYYLRDGAFLWLDRLGVDRRADSVASYIKDVDQMGFDRDKFRTAAGRPSAVS